MVRVAFESLFDPRPDGSLRPRRLVQIDGVRLGPDASFARGATFSGVDLAKFAGRDLEVDYLPDGAAHLVGVIDARTSTLEAFFPPSPPRWWVLVGAFVLGMIGGPLAVSFLERR